MATCNNCVHYEACWQAKEARTGNPMYSSTKSCDHFKDKTDNYFPKRGRNSKEIRGMEQKHIDARLVVSLALDAGCRYDCDQKEAIVDAIERTPAADVAPVVHGKWDRSGYCSQCDYWSCYCGEFNYCPKCGAKMDLGSDA